MRNKPKAMHYIEQSSVFGTLEVEFRTDGNDDKNSTCALVFKNVCGCYPFHVITTPIGCKPSDSNNYLKGVEIIFEGSGERQSVLDCLERIVKRARGDKLL